MLAALNRKNTINFQLLSKATHWSYVCIFFSLILGCIYLDFSIPTTRLTTAPIAKIVKDALYLPSCNTPPYHLPTP